MRLTISAVALAAALSAAPALAQTDAERAEALRSAAEALRGAIDALEQAASVLEGAEGAEGAGAADAAGAAEGEAAASGGAAAASGAQVEFLDPLDNTPLEIPSDGVTAEVAQFHATGENPYSGDQAAIADGGKLYNKLCAACHLKDATGRIGPNLVDDTSRYPRTNTAKGRFEIVYAGGAGAMQSFKSRISQDEMLRVLSYVESLKTP